MTWSTLLQFRKKIIRKASYTSKPNVTFEYAEINQEDTRNQQENHKPIEVIAQAIMQIEAKVLL